jgi:LPS sulfotransferase NodH
MSIPAPHVLNSRPHPRSLAWQQLCHQMRLARKWWLRPHAPFQPFFVIATCRSGSNLLLSYLSQQRGVRALGEVLCHLVEIGPRKDRLPPAKALQHIRYNLQGERTPIRGCKLMLYQLANCRLDLNDIHAAFPSAKYIILYRQSLAEQFVSHLAAMATKQFLLRPGEEQRRADLIVNPQHLRAYCDDTRRGYYEAISHRWLQGRSVLLSYEELVADPEYWLSEKICPLLGAPYAAPEARLRKQNTRALAEQVTNYRDVAPLLNSPLCRQYHVFPWERHAHRKAA